MSSEKKLKESVDNLNRRIKVIHFILPKIWNELLARLKECDSMDSKDWVELVNEVFDKEGRLGSFESCGFAPDMWIEFIGDLEWENGRIWYKDFRDYVIHMQDKLSFNLEMFDVLKGYGSPSNFNLGDVVKLKSHSGLHMTVDNFGDEGVKCIWINKNGDMSHGWFSKFSLDRVEI